MAEAKKNIQQAISEFQANLPEIKFDQVNPHFKSKFASLAAVTKAVVPELSKHGLSFSVGSFVENGLLILDAHLMHESGESRSLQFPITETNPQKIGSAISYGRRYALSALTGVVADEDDDGNAASTQSPAERKIAQAKTVKAPAVKTPAGGGKAAELKKEIADAIQAGKITSEDANAAVKKFSQELSGDSNTVEVLVAAKAELKV